MKCIYKFHQKILFDFSIDLLKFFIFGKHKFLESPFLVLHQQYISFFGEILIALNTAFPLDLKKQTTRIQHEKNI
jgi:hypothetical protein